ncbi:MAG TPA: radical SAM protein [Candidatus Krumholzibacteria bacterium]|nr:radical SAM protein [Candidatus Krumholzibacteria bacterium]
MDTNLASPTALRVAVTGRCNLACAYCAPAGMAPGRAAPLDLGPLADLVGWLHARLRLRKVRITGGEPLLREGVDGFVARLAALPAPPELALTTNGVLLADHARALRRAGLDRVNISLDTLDRDDFRALTGADALDRVLAGIDAARTAGLGPLKLNAVLRRSTWRRDVPALLDFAAAEGLELRFIELMRTGTADRWCQDERVEVHEVRGWLAAHADGGVATAPEATGAAPARLSIMPWRGRKLTVGWISPVSRPFCGACDRLRLSAGGRLRRCLMDPGDLDLVPVVADDDVAALACYLDGKRAPAAMDQTLPMQELGG